MMLRRVYFRSRCFRSQMQTTREQRQSRTRERDLDVSFSHVVGCKKKDNLQLKTRQREMHATHPHQWLFELQESIPARAGGSRAESDGGRGQAVGPQSLVEQRAEMRLVLMTRGGMVVMVMALVVTMGVDGDGGGCSSGSGGDKG